ncbi:SDR family NAD(P)-dependent oxidoreductase [Martelella limonii]|uniref:SDR family NAD(P)-dependent oxidoreductase n=1 Tax=Martelella limonii TaxID=1647649 RepID=UPI00158099F7|nr:SDR family NAD(P)-dependent oxidoreductase [Martelella limonii]
MSVLDRFSLAGKRALVTGAGRGIGRAIAIAFAEAGADLVLCARTAADLKAVASDIEALGRRAEIMVCDVTDIADFEAKVQHLPDIDIFCNNAGINRPKPIFDVTPDDYDAVMGINLRAAFFAARAMAMHMRDRKIKGSIINMSSQMGHTGAANRTLYCASKWGIEGLTKSLSIELGSYGIRINTICPTFIETPMTEPYFRDPGFKDYALSKIQLGRIGKVDDLTGAAVYLASEASSLVTGSAVMIDGGWTAS